MQTIASSAALEVQIAELLGDELGANGDKLAELCRLGASLVPQRAVKEKLVAKCGSRQCERRYSERNGVVANRQNAVTLPRNGRDEPAQRPGQTLTNGSRRRGRGRRCRASR